jgi:uncharacterized protein with FMN-binding domain
MVQSGSNKKVANSLVAASAAAVLAVYAAGYERTQAAAEKLDAQFTERRPLRSDTRVEGSSLQEAVSRPAASVTVPSDGAREERNAPSQIASLESAAPAEQAGNVPATPSPVVNPAPEPTAQAEQKPEAAIPPPAAPIASSQVPAPTVVPAPVPVTPAPIVSILAPPSVPAPAVPPAAGAPAVRWKDGTYTGWGTCRHGDIQAAVVIENGRIVSAKVAQCYTRYSCSVIDRIIPQVAQRQSAQVDWVSGATQSSDAFYYAVTEALSHAK